MFTIPVFLPADSLVNKRRTIKFAISEPGRPFNYVISCPQVPKIYVGARHEEYWLKVDVIPATAQLGEQSVPDRQNKNELGFPLNLLYTNM